MKNGHKRRNACRKRQVFIYPFMKLAWQNCMSTLMSVILRELATEESCSIENGKKSYCIDNKSMLYLNNLLWSCLSAYIAKC